jgi:small subunit ribosomal protein S7
MRSKRAKHQLTEPDLIYHNRQVAKLINRVMKDGKKSVAQQHVYTAFDIVKTNLKTDPLEAFEIAIKNIAPQLEVRSRRVGGAAYQVPIPVKESRATSLAIRWLVLEARKRSNKEYHTYSEKLAAELIDAYHNQGGAVQKKITSHKMADANKAFAHFRW